ncbi:MAG: hypothetical protein JST54_05210 [Deltaproteobacteria bacterium]|nr:hypothetical protein [Deltaproteobacteria bacterium]
MSKPALPVVLRPFLPLVRAWIAQVLAVAEAQAQPLGPELERALGRHFSPQLLQRARRVVCAQLPQPPVPTLGIARLREFKRGDYAGLTLGERVFVRTDHADDPGVMAHELVHVLQWIRLGRRTFVERYAAELVAFGYGQAPLERMAYAHEARFRAGEVYDLETAVQRELDA